MSNEDQKQALAEISLIGQIQELSEENAKLRTGCEELGDNLAATEAANELLSTKIAILERSRDHMLREKEALKRMLIAANASGVELEKERDYWKLKADIAADLCARMQAKLGPVE